MDGLRCIKLIAFDIDGVLTDGCVNVDEEGRESKRIALNDIDAMWRLHRDGIKLVAITGESTPIVKYFMKKVPWDDFVFGCKDKLSCVYEMLNKFSLNMDEIAYIGDGWYDVPSLKIVTYSFAPANAIQEAKEVSRIQLRKSGGNGCVAEMYKIIKEINQK